MEHTASTVSAEGGEMSKHTPGPWYIVEGDEWTTDIATNTPEQGIWTVASANKRRDEYKANMRLIAAAPDLLYALEQIINDLPTNRDWLDPEIERFAKEALARAKS